MTSNQKQTIIQPKLKIRLIKESSELYNYNGKSSWWSQLDSVILLKYRPISGRAQRVLGTEEGGERQTQRAKFTAARESKAHRRTRGRLTCRVHSPKESWAWYFYKIISGVFLRWWLLTSCVVPWFLQNCGEQSFLWGNLCPWYSQSPTTEVTNEATTNLGLLETQSFHNAHMSRLPKSPDTLLPLKQE